MNWNTEIDNLNLNDCEGVDFFLRQSKLKLSEVKPVLKHLNFYEQGVCFAYLKLGSFRAIEQEVGIRYSSVYRSFMKAIKKIKPSDYLDVIRYEQLREKIYS